MNKKVVFIIEEGKLVDVLDVKTIMSVEEFGKLIDEAKKNKKELEEKRYNEEAAADLYLKGSLSELERRLDLAELELFLLRGEITEEEYDERKKELCGTK